MDICEHLPNLKGLYLAINQLSGQLPTTMSLCGELVTVTICKQIRRRHTKRNWQLVQA